MAKPNLAGKLKNLARDLKEENKSTSVKKLGDAVKSAEAKKKPIGDTKVSGRKD